MIDGGTASLAGLRGALMCDGDTWNGSTDDPTCMASEQRIGIDGILFSIKEHHQRLKFGR